MPKISFDEEIPAPVRRAAGRWLVEKGKWSWWVTLTFARTVSEDGALGVFRRWLRSVAQLVDEHVLVVFALETAGGNFHLHALLELRTDSRAVNGRMLESLWRKLDPVTGFCRLKRYDPDLDAADYIVKTNGWNIVKACPRKKLCRRAGCIEAPGLW